MEGRISFVYYKLELSQLLRATFSPETKVTLRKDPLYKLGKIFFIDKDISGM